MRLAGDMGVTCEVVRKPGLTGLNLQGFEIRYDMLSSYLLICVVLSHDGIS